MSLQPGQRLRSQVDGTQVVVIRAEGELGEVTCGGHPLIDYAETPAETVTTVPGHDGGTLLGKRYVLDGSGLELLAVSGGSASLAMDGTPLTIKAAKPLPASD